MNISLLREVILDSRRYLFCKMNLEYERKENCEFYFGDLNSSIEAMYNWLHIFL